MTVAVTVDDDDSAGIDVSVASLEVDEGDASGESYTVRLDTLPSATVTVTVSRVMPAPMCRCRRRR